MAIWPQFNEERVINFDVATFNGSYASNNGMLVFVIENTLFVTTARNQVFSALEGFTKPNFYVPFSNGDYPKNEEYRWKQLLAIQNDQCKKDFTKECLDYAEKNYIGILREDVLAKCFKVPETGVKIKNLNYEDWIFPTFAGHYFDCYHQPEMLGTYCTNNGRVVFIYRDGNTFVAKGYKIINDLIAAGFKEKGLFVPFSNGEVIQDPIMRARWEAINK